MESTLSPSQITQSAHLLTQARREAKELEPLTKSQGSFSLSEGYRIQKEGVGHRLEAGEKIIGYKMGLTSKAKMEQMGLHQPIYGVLTNAMEVKNNSTFYLKNKIHPKAEPEVYFVTNRDLSGDLTPAQVLESCSEVGVALEILDSRYRGFKYFTLPDVVADNSSSAYFVLGASVKPPFDLNFKTLAIEISENGQKVHQDSAAAILGDPLLSLCELLRLFKDEKKTLPQGSIVLAGAATPAIDLKAGQTISAQLEKVGRVHFTVE